MRLRRESSTSGLPKPTRERRGAEPTPLASASAGAVTRAAMLVAAALLCGCGASRPEPPRLLVSWAQDDRPDDGDDPPEGGPQPEPYVPDPEPFAVHKLRLTNPTDQPIVVTLPTRDEQGTLSSLAVAPGSTRVLTVRAAPGSIRALAASLQVAFAAPAAAPRATSISPTGSQLPSSDPPSTHTSSQRTPIAVAQRDPAGLATGGAATHQGSSPRAHEPPPLPVNSTTLGAR